MGRCFIRVLDTEMDGIQEHCWNVEQLIVFQNLILQRACHVLVTQEIRRRLLQFLDAWEAGQYQIMVKHTMLSCKQLLLAARRDYFEEQRARTYTSLSLYRNIRDVVYCIMYRERVVVFQQQRT